jgi:hypothetical protein
LLIYSTIKPKHFLFTAVDGILRCGSKCHSSFFIAGQLLALSFRVSPSSFFFSLL